jgi:hypothetical protein
VTIISTAYTGEAYQRYVWDLTNAIAWRDWIYDPSYALSQDSDIYSKIIRDPIAAHAMRYRKSLVAGVEYTVAAGGDLPEDKALAAIVEELIDGISGFTDARMRLCDAIFRGSAYEFIEGQRELRSPGGQKQNYWWCPTRLVNVDRRRFRRARDQVSLNQYWELWSVKRQRWEPLLHPEWFVRSCVEETEDTLGYGRGLLDTLYTFQAAKARVLRDAMRVSQRCGMGFLKASIDNLRGADGKPVASDGRDGDSVASAWITALQKQAAEDVLVHDARDDVELLTGWSEGFEITNALIEYFDHSQVMATLGAVVQTMKPEGGSFALAKEQADSTESLIRIDRCRLGEDLSRDLVGSILRNNRYQIAEAGLQEAAKPNLQITHGKHQDPEMWSRVVRELVSMGIRLRAEEVYEKTGFTRPGIDDDVIEASAQPTQTPISDFWKRRKNKL